MSKNLATQFRRQADLFAELARVSRAIACDLDGAAPEAEADSVEVRQALADLPSLYRPVLQRAAYGVLAENQRGQAVRWLDVEEATADVAATPRGSKRVITTIRQSDPALNDLGYYATPDEGVLVGLPETIATVVRDLWGPVSDEAVTEDDGEAGDQE